MAGSVEDTGAPESWEMADLDESMNRLMVSCKKNSAPCSSSGFPDFVDDSPSTVSAAGGSSARVVSEDVINQVDQFLREALQNPRERLSVLRIEQDIEKFVRDRSRQQLEFHQLPTSYLRLAAHRVAQHYNLQSMVILDNSQPDGSGSIIVVHKTFERRYPAIRLADIPVNLPQEENGSAVKVAIKQRPQKRSQSLNSGSSNSSKGNHAKTVEERKEEYNRARARIFSSTSGSNGASVKSESERAKPDIFQAYSLGSTRLDEKPVGEGPEISSGRGLRDSSPSSTRTGRVRIENEPVGRYRANNKVAIIRDREVDRKDPDYDRNYDRYVQRFDPGFGFGGGPYTVQPLYTPAVNYNTEFPQLGSPHRPQIPIEHQPRPIPPHLRAPWDPAGIGYGPPETMMAQMNPNHIGTSTSTIYLHSSPYPYPRPGMQFINTHEHVHVPYAQPHHQQQCETSFGLARPR